MEKSVQIYVGKEKLHIVLCGIDGSVMSFFRSCKELNRKDLDTNFISSGILDLLSVSDSEFQTNSQPTECDLMGYASFHDMYKKTNLLDLRLEEGAIRLYKGKKVKRWYEFEPISDVGYNGSNASDMKNLSAAIVKVVRQF